MKWLSYLTIIFHLILFAGCHQESIKSKATPTPKPKAEFTREVFDVNKYPGLSAIGKVKIEKSWCALTLVAEDIAVTAGHCFIAQQANLFKEENRLRDLNTVEFKSINGTEIKNVRVESIIKYKIDPDFAIVKLNKKIPKELIEPLEISDMNFTDILGNSEKVGCAGFNGDKELGDRGKNLTISKNIKIYYKESNSKKIDTNCVSTNGGSGGLFFEEKYNAETKSSEYLLLGVIWGVTNDNFDMKGERINDKEIVTSITPVKVFRDELKKIIDENK